MRWLPIAVALLCAAPAAAQPNPPNRAPKALSRSVPALYWARVSSIISKRMSPFPKGLTAQVRVYFDETGAITHADFKRHSGVEVFDRILERVLADFAPSAKERLPVPTDEKLRASVLKEGVTVVIRSRPPKNAGKRRINLPMNLKKKSE